MGRIAVFEVPRSLVRTLVLVVSLVIGAFAAPGLAQRRHQYQWVGPINVRDFRSDGVQILYRKGDNDVRERGHVNLYEHNRYKVKVIITFKFTLTYQQTGRSVTYTPTYELGPEGSNEDPGDWHQTPEMRSDSIWAANGWENARFSVTNVEVTDMRMAMPSDPSGQTWEVYPKDERSRRETQLQQEEASRKQREQDEARKRQEEDARQQRDAQALEQKQRDQRQQQEQRQQQQEQLRKQQEQQTADARRRQEQWQRDQDRKRQQMLNDLDERQRELQSMLDSIASQAEYSSAKSRIQSALSQQKLSIMNQDLTDGIEDPAVAKLADDLKAQMLKEAVANSDVVEFELDAAYHKSNAEASSQQKGQELGALISTLSQASSENRLSDAKDRAQAARRNAERLMEKLDTEKQAALQRRIDAQEKARSEQEATDKRSNAAQQFAQAKTAMDGGDLDEAIRCAREASTLDPGNIEYPKLLDDLTKRREKTLEAAKTQTPTSATGPASQPPLSRPQDTYPLQKMGSMWVQREQLSPDGSLCVSTDQDKNAIHLYSKQTGQEVRVLTGFHGINSACTPVVFSPDGSLLAAEGTGKTVAIWDVATGEELRRFKGSASGWVGALYFSPDGKTLFEAHGDGNSTVVVWSVDTGRKIRTMKAEAPGYGRVPADGLSPNGRLVALGDGDKAVTIWDAVSGRRVRTVRISALCQFIQFSPDSRLVACYDDSFILTVWNVATGKKLIASRVTALQWCFSQNSKWIATLSNNEKVSVWELSTGKRLWSLSGSGASFAPNSRAIAIVNESAGAVSMRSVSNGSELRSLKSEVRPSSCMFAADGSRLRVVDNSGGTRMWDVSDIAR